MLLFISSFIPHQIVLAMHRYATKYIALLHICTARSRLMRELPFGASDRMVPCCKAEPFPNHVNAKPYFSKSMIVKVS